MKYIGLIDLGSHEISLSIVSVTAKKQYSFVEKLSRTLAMGADTYSKSRVSLDKIRELGEIFSDFSLKLKEYPEIEVLAFAESAIREAENRSYVLDYLKFLTGVEVKVLSNNEQVLYQLYSYYDSIKDFERYIQEGAMFVDLGAGSVQFSLFLEGKLVSSQNMRLGSLRLNAVLEELEERSLNFQEYLLEYIWGDLTYFQKFEGRLQKVRHLFLSGENLTYIRALSHKPASEFASLSRDDLNKILEDLPDRSYDYLVRIEHIPEEHARLILPTALLLREVFRFTGRDEAYLPDSPLDKGVFLAHYENNFPALRGRDWSQDQIELARNLARRYEAEEKHCQQVEFLSLELFDALKKRLRLSPQDRHYLHLAAILHNVGKFINIVSEDRRSFDIVRSLEIPGLSPEELYFIALLIYFHESDNRQRPEIESELTPDRQLAMDKLCCLLGLANAMDTSHQQKIKKIKLDEKRGRMRLALYSEEDISLELWKLSKEQCFFQDVFSTELEILTRPYQA